MTDVERAIAAIRGGNVVVIPTDTVYGLACAPVEDATRRLYALKGRTKTQPTALVAASVAVLEDLIAELPSSAVAAARALLPGPYTLVLPNTARRFRWLTGDRPDTIGVRVPRVSGEATAVLEAVGVVVATSANLPGGPDPRRLADVPPEIRDRVDAMVDGGELPGVPSTVIDLTGDDPVVLREGAAPAAAALARLGA